MEKDRFFKVNSNALRVSLSKVCSQLIRPAHWNRSNFQNCFSPTWLMAERTNDYDRSLSELDANTKGWSEPWRYRFVANISLPLWFRPRRYFNRGGLVISWKRICFDISGIQLHRKWENVIDRSSTLRSTNLRKRWIILTMTAQCESIHYLRRVTRTDNA